ncbi:LAMI_0D09252g1_1 [Lachancea mirantina]|uniref:LAMI_0D09252g1_1 n=1 Tax=Lachancea mirantina TaxID=1230905 RepID=A0A1G4JDE6_9SACH|nr:LAMI_0D09252g1_1 [Lachancea mirantina]
MEYSGEKPTHHEAEGILAKEFTLDIPRIPSVELPLDVRPTSESVGRAIKMCGGIRAIKNALVTHRDRQDGLELYLNHGKKEDGTDIYFNEHPIIGRQVPQRDESIILKISLPKGTLAANNGDLKKALANVSSKKYKVVPVGVINHTIRFREMSDFQMRLDNSSSAQEFSSSFGSLDWPNFKKYVESIPDQDPRPTENINSLIFQRNPSAPATDFQFVPPPRFSMVKIPFLYRYEGNPYATKASNGKAMVKGTYLKNHQQLVYTFGPETRIPSEPHAMLKKAFETAKETGVYPGSSAESGFLVKLENCIAILEDLFSKRPIWVKRHIDGIIPMESQPALKIALSLTSYRFTKGPWRNTYIKLGLDPRSSSEFARYQTEYFKIESKLLKSPGIAKNIPSPPPRFYQSNTPGEIDTRFVFDGKQIPWYLMLQIDLLISEPNIAEIYSSITYLDEPTELTGWLHELDLVKFRRIVKYELGCMVQGNFEFSEYKLKFFKSMLYPKESMISQGATSHDAEGDIDMDTSQELRDPTVLSNSNNGDSDEEDEDNGVQTGDIDDIALAQEGEEAEQDEDEQEEEEEANFGASQSDDAFTLREDENDTSNFKISSSQISSGNEAFDIKAASFLEIIERIAQKDPETAQMLRQNLDSLSYDPF